MAEYFLLIASVLIGAVFVIIFKPKQQYIGILLSFSGAYLLSVTVLDILPEVYKNDNFKNYADTYVGIFILIGILFQSVLEAFSRGAEHGHIHLHSHSNNFTLALFISLSIHAFYEGIPVSYVNTHNLLAAIIVHKIPVSIILATFLLNSKLSKSYIYIFIIMFSIMSPMGALLSEKLTFFTKYRLEIMGITTGIFLHISTIILFESSKNHKFNYSKFIAILGGMAIALWL